MSAQRRAIGAMALGGLLFGFDTAVVAGVTEALRGGFAPDPVSMGIAVSSALWGTLAGALLSGAPGDRYGSRSVLRGVGLLYLVSAVGCALATGLWMFAAFRFIGGVAIGASSVLAPVYIAEISPPARRGRLVGTFQLNIVIGILAAYLVNGIIGAAFAGDIAWRIKLAVAALPAALFLILLAGVPQSPRWLNARGRREEATAAAGRLGVELTDAAAPEGGGRLDWRRHRRPILLAVAVGLFNQLSGINAILYYLNDIFAAGGFAELSADAQAVAVGAANLVATLAGIAIIDRVGRRPLLIGGGVGCAAVLLGVALTYDGALEAEWLLPLLVLFITAFAMSQGAVIWVYLSEIFPTEVRARGQAVGSATHWIANAVIAFVFPLLTVAGPAIPFYGFAAAMLLQSFVVWRVFPETKQRTLEAITS
ncbi:MFS transporter [Sphingomonas spermidinifaciens]|uniref:MFS transporter n=1 Tax=Sphingomonas spermidinifaciens TaxID=1141889 RepID=A0A2A4B432_9SPHN|nr:sugar porter family MFS transporter [Sphingomonas spermidinifaciens]PCD02434.1 MFS transporter [Sphingomonas spermidinifaciens]